MTVMRVSSVCLAAIGLVLLGLQPLARIMGTATAGVDPANEKMARAMHALAKSNRRSFALHPSDENLSLGPPGRSG